MLYVVVKIIQYIQFEVKKHNIKITHFSVIGGYRIYKHNHQILLINQKQEFFITPHLSEQIIPWETDDDYLFGW